MQYPLRACNVAASYGRLPHPEPIFSRSSESAAQERAPYPCRIPILYIFPTQDVYHIANATSGKRHLMRPPCSPRQQAHTSSAMSIRVGGATPVQTLIPQVADLSLRWVLNMLLRVTSLITSASCISHDHGEQVLLLLAPARIRELFF